jgi:glycosyltransferase involved in cell wall biosynthesis
LQSKRILISCFEVPGWGGASTSAYELFAKMQSDGYNVSFVNLISESDEDFFKFLFNGSLGNPKQLENVYNNYLSVPQYAYQRKLYELVEEISPDVILAIGWIAALIFKKTVSKKLIYLTTGSDQVKNYIRYKRLENFIYLDKYIRKNNYKLKKLSKEESKAVITSDLVITHSRMMRNVYRYFYSALRGKIYSEIIWFAEWIYKEAYKYKYLSKNFSEREIDLIFIASDWRREEKNFKLVKKLTPSFKNLNVNIIGVAAEYIPGVKFSGIVADREHLFRLLGNSKTIVCPSVFDSAPGILFEASALGCNIITSKNCGNWQICNEELLVDPFTVSEFRNKIILSLAKKYPDNIDFFLSTNSYQKLIEVAHLI